MSSAGRVISRDEIVAMRAAKRMRALTILQPSAQAIYVGEKPWENREEGPPSTVLQGEWIALHAGVALYAGAAVIRALWPECPASKDLPRNAVLGAWRLGPTDTPADVAMLASVPHRYAAYYPPGNRFALGPKCIRVDDVVRLPAPLPCPEGFHRGWWWLPPRVADEVWTAVDAAHDAYLAGRIRRHIDWTPT